LKETYPSGRAYFQAKQGLLFVGIAEMLRLAVVEFSKSTWNNQTTLVQKSGRNRLCLDARKLKTLTVKNSYPITKN